MSDNALWCRIETEEQRRAEADLMLAAVKRKDKTDFFRFIRDMVSGLGIRNVFYGIYDVVAIALFAVAACFLFLLYNGNGLSGLGENAYVCALACSPMIYIGFFALTFIKEKSEGSYEVKMTCRYTALHLCAFRMFIGSGFCFIVNTAAMLLVSSYTGQDFLKLIAVSLFSLFTFALVTILSLLRNGMRGFYIPVAFLFAVIILCAAEPFREIVQSVPTQVYAVIGAVMLFLFQKELYSVNRRLCNVIR